MARVFITGSSDGLGLLAAKRLIAEGHRVVLHGRNDARSRDALAAAPGAETAVAGDLATFAGTKGVAEAVNRLGRFDAVIHNAGVGYRRGGRTETEPGIPEVVAVNVLAPYVLTALIGRPGRLVYLSSGMQRGAHLDLDDLLWRRRRWSGPGAYAESKLCDVLIAFAVARRWPKVKANAVEPGWVPTKMGGAGAPGDLEAGCETQAWLATSGDALAQSSGLCFYHRRPCTVNPTAADVATQEALLAQCRQISGVVFPDE